MNEIAHKFLLAGDKFLPEMHLRFTKNKEKIQKFKETINSRYIYQNELDKACFQHDMVYGDFKDLSRRTASDKILRDKEFKIAKNPKYDGYQRDLSSMVYRFFDNKTSGSGVKNENMSGQNMSTFIDNIWGADFADMQLISKFNKGFRFLLCAIDISSKYAWVIPLKEKKNYNY